MALPSTRELKGVIVDILKRARDDGRLGDLTVRIVLRQIATHYGLEEDVFHSKSYKPFIKDTVYATMNSFDSDPSSGETHFPKRKVVKEDGSVRAGKRKRRSTIQVHSSNEERPEEDDASDNETPSRKKASARSPSKAKLGKTSKKPESDTKYKSKAIIESSEEGAAPESSAQKPASLQKKGKTSTKPSSPKQKQGDSDVEMDPDEGPVLSSSGSKPTPVTVSPRQSVSKAKEMSGDPMESELSSVNDEAPTKRRRKEQEKLERPRRDEKTKRGKKKEALSKEEETVNKLKCIVVACGVRKVWKKEFEGLDKPSQQIKRLHSVLSDLGMTPRYSMEKAKTIKERRELAQELKEVQEFDKAMKRRGKGLPGSSETAEAIDQGDSDANAPVRKKNARASIMAFLQDQSEEE